MTAAPEAPAGLVARGPAVDDEDGILAGPADYLLARAAARWPDRTAIVSAEGVWTFAELDDAADELAAHLSGRWSTPAVVAVASTLTPQFVVAYHGVLRSGNIVAPINPLLNAAAIAHNLAAAEARLVIAPAAYAERVAGVLDQLPAVEAVLPLEAVPAVDIPAADGLPPRKAGQRLRPGSGDPACVLFTSGTTGLPKAVVLSHGNVTVNAMQVARAHELGGGTVSAVNLPTYHPMHLNPALLSGTTQVLCPALDAGRLLAQAGRYGATHLYSLPAWLTRLAAAEGPAGAPPALRMIASGGSALAPAIATALRERFDVPVLQGYGLAETSPLTHSDAPGTTVPGSVGHPVAGTECVVVDPTTGRVLPAGEAGEVRVAGPQVMLGYLGEAPGSHLDEDGRLPTGDIGRLDPDGRLHLVDRMKDVFKRDNWIVSPTTVERRLAGHPAVADCAVVDCPDQVSGAVAAAFVVLRAEAEAAEIAAFANHDAPPYEHVEFVELVPALPRSPNGKIVRGELRAEIRRLRRVRIHAEGVARMACGEAAGGEL